MLASICIVWLYSGDSASALDNHPLPADSSESAAVSISVASINLCADQLLLLLAEPEQIVSLSNLAADSAGSYYFKRAARYPLNNAIAEHLVLLSPDLVLAGEYSNLHTVALLRELGIRVETLKIADSIPDIMDNISNVARWIGREDLGNTIVADLQMRLDALPAPELDRPKAVVYDPNGYSVGQNSMRGQILELAGWHNVASDAGIDSFGRLSLEQLIQLKPDAVMSSPYSPGTYSRGQALGRHPALFNAGLDPLVMYIPSREVICAGPWTVDVIDELVRHRSGLQRATP